MKTNSYSSPLLPSCPLLNFRKLFLLVNNFVYPQATRPGHLGEAFLQDTLEFMPVTATSNNLQCSFLYH